MDAERIAEIKARVDAATDGPWDSYRPNQAYRVYEVLSTSPAGLNDVLAEVSGFNASADADLIAHAPTDIEDLLAERDRLTTERDALAAAPAEQTARADHEDRCAVTAQRTADRATARLDAVRELHHLASPEGVCHHDREPWPCATTRKIDGEPAVVVLPTAHSVLGQPGAVHVCTVGDVEQDRGERADLIERALALVGEAWDDGNAVGLDGWVGPGRGSGEVDREAQHARTRMVHRAESTLNVAAIGGLS